jgi:hypothetical protein
MIRVATRSDVDGIRQLMKSVSGFWDEDWRADVLERVIGSAEAVALVHLDGETKFCHRGVAGCRFGR